MNDKKSALTRPVVLGAKKNDKGQCSMQGRMYHRGYTLTFFIQCDDAGLPKIYNAKDEDETPILYIQVTEFANGDAESANDPFSPHYRQEVNHE